MANAPGCHVALVVEDEQIIRMLAAEALRDAGLVVFEAEHAAEALEIVAAQSGFQLLFTDVNMPGEMNGIDLAEHLLAGFPDIKVIITSALPVLRPLDHLPVSFLTKPYGLAHLCETALGLLAA